MDTGSALAEIKRLSSRKLGEKEDKGEKSYIEVAMSLL
jgi:hypothetical protein